MDQSGELLKRKQDKSLWKLGLVCMAAIGLFAAGLEMQISVSTSARQDNLKATATAMAENPANWLREVSQLPDGVWPATVEYRQNNEAGDIALCSAVVVSKTSIEKPDGRLADLLLAVYTGHCMYNDQGVPVLPEKAQINSQEVTPLGMMPITHPGVEAGMDQVYLVALEAESDSLPNVRPLGLDRLGYGDIEGKLFVAGGTYLPDGTRVPIVVDCQKVDSDEKGYSVVETGLLPGISGSPVVDSQGNLVGIMQLSTTISSTEDKFVRIADNARVIAAGFLLEMREVVKSR